MSAALRLSDHQTASDPLWPAAGETTRAQARHREPRPPGPAGSGRPIADEAVGTVEVRLALHVLRPLVRDRRLLNEFWHAATSEIRHPWTSCHLPYRRIAERLIENGSEVDADNRP